MAHQELGEVARPLVRRVAKNNNGLHTRILTLDRRIRNTRARRRLLFGALALLALPAVACAADQITLHALSKDKAIVLIDGVRRVLKTGDASPEGVKLLATNTRDETAEIEFDGQRRELRLGVVISSFVSVGGGSVTLYPAEGGHYFTDGVVNGLAVRFMVDTGATTIALSGAEAQRLGIDYQKRGRQGHASTAGGTVRTYSLMLDVVQVGAITLHNVEASVIHGNFPRPALLGMSFLGRLDMKRDAEKLELIQR
jgi:aspartyl protease family protein